MFYPESWYNPGLSFRTPPFVVAVLVAFGGANALGALFHLFRLRRHRQL